MTAKPEAEQQALRPEPTELERAVAAKLGDDPYAITERHALIDANQQARIELAALSVRLRRDAAAVEAALRHGRMDDDKWLDLQASASMLLSDAVALDAAVTMARPE